MLNLLTNVAVQSQNALASIARLSNIMEGVDGSEVFGYNVEQESIQIEDNQTLQHAHMHTFDIRCIEDSANSAILDAIVAGNYKAKISGYSPDGFLIWHEPSLIVRNKQYDNVFASAVLATVKSTPNFRGTPPARAVHAGKNLLGVFDVTSITTATLKGLSILFPFPGLSLTASGSGGDVGFSFRDSSDTEISSSTGVSPHTATIPANTVYIRFDGGATISNPMIGRQGITTFEL